MAVRIGKFQCLADKPDRFVEPSCPPGRLRRCGEYPDELLFRLPPTAPTRSGTLQQPRGLGERATLHCYHPRLVSQRRGARWRAGLVPVIGKPKRLILGQITWSRRLQRRRNATVPHSPLAGQQAVVDDLSREGVPETATLSAGHD